MLLIPILIVIAVVYFLSRPNHHVGFDSMQGNAAEEILRKRYAAGEINEETYQKMLQALRRN